MVTAGQWRVCFMPCSVCVCVCPCPLPWCTHLKADACQQSLEFREPPIAHRNVDTGLCKRALEQLLLKQRAWAAKENDEILENVKSSRYSPVYWGLLH